MAGVPVGVVFFEELFIRRLTLRLRGSRGKPQLREVLMQDRGNSPETGCPGLGIPAAPPSGAGRRASLAPGKIVVQFLKGLLHVRIRRSSPSFLTGTAEKTVILIVQITFEEIPDTTKNTHTISIFIIEKMCSSRPPGFCIYFFHLKKTTKSAVDLKKILQQVE
jgi:hypothetical protein